MKFKNKVNNDKVKNKKRNKKIDVYGPVILLYIIDMLIASSLIIFFAFRLIPIFGAIFYGAIGLSQKATNVEILSMWFFPVLFVVAFMFVLLYKFISFIFGKTKKYKIKRKKEILGNE